MHRSALFFETISNDVSIGIFVESDVLVRSSLCFVKFEKGRCKNLFVEIEQKVLSFFLLTTQCHDCRQTCQRCAVRTKIISGVDELIFQQHFEHTVMFLGLKQQNKFGQMYFKHKKMWINHKSDDV